MILRMATSQVTDGVNRAQGVQVRGPHASASTPKTWREPQSAPNEHPAQKPGGEDARASRSGWGGAKLASLGPLGG